MGDENADTFEVSAMPTTPSPLPAIPAEPSQSSTADETGDENEVTFEVSTMPTTRTLSPLPAIPPEPSTTTCEFVEPRVQPVEVDAYEA
jgi:hypothetical protein